MCFVVGDNFNQASRNPPLLLLADVLCFLLVLEFVCGCFRSLCAGFRVVWGGERNERANLKSASFLMFSSSVWALVRAQLFKGEEEGGSSNGLFLKLNRTKMTFHIILDFSRLLNLGL